MLYAHIKFRQFHFVILQQSLCEPVAGDVCFQPRIKVCHTFDRNSNSDDTKNDRSYAKGTNITSCWEVISLMAVLV
jgi:hypothetical protein